MSESLQARLSLEELARTGRKLHGTVPAAALGGRVSDTLGVDSPAGEVAYELAFAPAPAGAVAVSGRVSARMKARCQRCLELFDLELEAPIRLLAASDDGVPEPPPGWELSEHGLRPRLIDLVEEELLLAVPLAPRHAEEECRSPAGGGDPGEAQHPFRVLSGKLGDDRRE